MSARPTDAGKMSPSRAQWRDFSRDLRALVMDDEREARELFHSMLMECGAEDENSRASCHNFG